MKTEEILAIAKKEGFTGAAVISTDRVVFDPAFRPYCAENLCGQYGANYSCPPDCGTPEEMKEKVQKASDAAIAKKEKVIEYVKKN